jgi:ribosome-associated protein
MTIEKKLQLRIFDSEFEFLTSRSSGPGGQHVNTTNTKVQLLFNITDSTLFSDFEKEIIKQKLQLKIDNSGTLHLQAQEHRSQKQNKEAVVKKFYDLLHEVFKKRKIRKATRPGKSAVEKRLKAKKIQSEKKQQRGNWESN